MKKLGQWILLTAVAGLLSACSSTGARTQFMDDDGFTVKVAQKESSMRNPAIESVVWQAQYSNVLLVTKEGGAPANQHPQAISEERLKRILGGLSIRVGKGEPQALFLVDELDVLVPPLSKALALAKPEQDVVFYIPQKRGFALLQEELMTTARVFYQNDKLHIIFGKIQGDFEGQLRAAKVFKQYATGSRSQSANLRERFVAQAGLSFPQEKRLDWLAFDTGAAAVALSGDKAPIEERLQALDNLKQKGLITEAEYEAKRKAILQAF